jgi:hypothetical protein
MQNAGPAQRVLGAILALIFLGVGAVLAVILLAIGVAVAAVVAVVLLVRRGMKRLAGGARRAAGVDADGRRNVTVIER